MQITIENNSSGLISRINLKLKKFQIYNIILFIFLSYCILFLFFSILAPVYEIRNVRTLYGSDQDENRVLSGMNDRTDSLLKRSAVLNSRLLMSENDSTGIFVSLTDSLLTLELQGVTIHQSKISSCGLSNFFPRLDNPTLVRYLSTPFHLEKYQSTIVKVPVVIKHAPKDTSEANKISSLPQLPPDEYVRFSLCFDKSLSIIIEQEEKPSGKQKLTRISSRYRDKLRLFAETSSSVFRFRIPGYHANIRLKIPGDDAKTIFRALPENTLLVLEL